MAGMSDTEKDVQVLERHFIDLSRAAYQRDRITFSDFLDLNEQNILHKLPKDRLYTRVVSFGGFPLQSVRWRHLSLMLFLCVGEKRSWIPRRRATLFLSCRSLP